MSVKVPKESGELVHEQPPAPSQGGKMVHNIRHASVAEWSNAHGCKPCDSGLRRFESCPAHTEKKDPEGGLSFMKFRLSTYVLHAKIVTWYAGMQPRS